MYKWGRIKGEMAREERLMLRALVQQSLSEAEPLYKHSGTPQHQGVIESARTVLEFNYFQEFHDFWQELQDGIADAVKDGENVFRERLRGQQKFVETAIEHLVAWRVVHQTTAEYVEANVSPTAIDFVKKFADTF